MGLTPMMRVLSFNPYKSCYNLNLYELNLKSSKIRQK